MKRHFGIVADEHDHRDRIYAPARGLRLPASVDLRPHCPPVFDQRSLNSCTANAIAGAVWFDEHRERARDAAAPSRLFIYFNERRAERVITRNVPVCLRDGYKSVSKHGVCDERLWPYRVRRFAEAPPKHCYRAAKDRRVTGYFRVYRTLDHLRGCLAEGFPFTAAFSAHASLISAKVKHTGLIPLPTARDKALGGHAMLVVGYHDDTERFIVRNSWGRGWGRSGYGFIPYAYLLHERLSWDFWTARRTTS